MTEPVNDPRLHVEHLRDEDLVALVPSAVLPDAHEPIPLADLARETLILPPAGNPLRDEVETAARAERVELRVPIEVEGIRLIADLVGGRGRVDPARDRGRARSRGRAPDAHRACRRAASRS